MHVYIRAVVAIKPLGTYAVLFCVCLQTKRKVRENRRRRKRRRRRWWWRRWRLRRLMNLRDPHFYIRQSPNSGRRCGQRLASSSPSRLIETAEWESSSKCLVASWPSSALSPSPTRYIPLITVLPTVRNFRN